jgi:hypothetical protein
MKLFRLLQLDSAQVEYGLVRSFGDSFLVSHNRIYGNIRREALNCGFTFSDNPDIAYLTLPLTQLNRIMESRIIPYVDNTEVLRSLEIRCPRQIDFFEIRENLKKNHGYHESCHGIARHWLGKLTDQNSRLHLLIEESFSNSCELFGILEAEDAAHRIFYEMNSYTSLFDIRTNLKRACEELGREVMFRFFMLGYLHSNHLFSSYSESDFMKTAIFVTGDSGSRLSAQQLKMVRGLVKVCFTLDFNFRTTTTGLFLKLNGIPALNQDATSSEYLDIIFNGGYRECLGKLTEIALGGLYESR